MSVGKLSQLQRWAVLDSVAAGPLSKIDEFGRSIWSVAEVGVTDGGRLSGRTRRLLVYVVW